MLTVFDTETSRFPDGSPYRKSAQLISWACADERNNSIFSYWSDPDFKSQLQGIFNEATLIVGINLKFDIGWASRLGVKLPNRIRIWDCQLAEFILSGQTASFASMDDLCKRYSIEGKRGGLEEYWNAGIETRDIPMDTLRSYNVGDVSRTLQIYLHQLKDERMNDKLKKLIHLCGLDLLVLQQMEENGILYDKQGSITKGNEVVQELETIRKELQEVIQFDSFNLDSGDHLSCFLYGGVVSIDRYAPVTSTYKTGPRKGEEYTQNKFQETIRREFQGLFKPLPKTALKKDGYYSTAEGVLRQLPARNKQQRFVIERLLRQADLSKLVGSFLHKIPRMFDEKGWEDSILHPQYHQCVARTGRLSCSEPAAQTFDDVTSVYWISRYAS